jgi:hypothetical protein
MGTPQRTIATHAISNGKTPLSHPPNDNASDTADSDTHTMVGFGSLDIQSLKIILHPPFLICKGLTSHAG